MILLHQLSKEATVPAPQCMYAARSRPSKKPLCALRPSVLSEVLGIAKFQQGRTVLCCVQPVCILRVSSLAVLPVYAGSTAVPARRPLDFVHFVLASSKLCPVFKSTFPACSSGESLSLVSELCSPSKDEAVICLLGDIHPSPLYRPYTSKLFHEIFFCTAEVILGPQARRRVRLSAERVSTCTEARVWTQVSITLRVTCYASHRFEPSLSCIAGLAILVGHFVFPMPIIFIVS